MKFHERLTWLLSARGVSQRQLAQATGLSQNVTSQLSTGKQRVYADQAVTIAKALGVEVGQLIDDSVELPSLGHEDMQRRALVKLASEVGVDNLFKPPEKPADPEDYESHCLRMESRLLRILADNAMEALEMRVAAKTKAAASKDAG